MKFLTLFLNCMQENTTKGKNPLLWLLFHLFLNFYNNENSLLPKMAENKHCNLITVWLMFIEQENEKLREYKVLKNSKKSVELSNILAYRVRQFRYRSLIWRLERMRGNSKTVKWVDCKLKVFYFLIMLTSNMQYDILWMNKKNIHS